MNKKSKHKKPMKRVHARKKDEGQSYVRFDPFEGIPRDELIKGLKELGELKTANFKSEFDSLTTNLLKSHPLSLLSILAHYGLTQYIDDKGDSPKRENWISQHHVELLQALMLAHEFDEYRLEQVLPPLVQDVWNDLLKGSKGVGE